MRELSVVVASQDAAATVARCLASLEAQNTSGAAEIIVVDNSRDGSAGIVAERFPGVRLLRVPDPSLIPELWARGSEHAEGKIVAFTTAHCIPDAEWIGEILRHHESPYAGVGGTIENLEPSSLLQWAIFFCRYSAYMPPVSTRPVAQIPGDNGAYKRWVLTAYADLIKTGFWETVVNDRLRADGHALLLTPLIRIAHGPSFGMWAFCRQRFVLGRFFGAGRGRAASSVRRLLYLAASPLIPLIFLGKITRQVLAKRRHRQSFVYSLPLLTAFVLSWSLGESLSYLQEAFRGLTGARHTTTTETIAPR